ncbi:DUF1573 domain-containing protein [Flavobacterium zepuense]|uniref:DUF1573 domain-containing protein n=1 Tax=Flavobacterium zepuense TaxID=2593302 RepID=A0A552UX10_9FLAO|nr:DUF1573 domain-containing protein [Flavobacterium zepuense]TRW22756.1 DUF1573 domain-containing protein [Flavobacterium zepuense]
MKSLKLSLFAVAGALFLSFSANAQQVTPKKDIKPTGTAVKPAAAAVNPDAKPTGLTFKEDTFSFGDIEKGKPVSHEFTFKNTSKQTILITNVKASCGCTATNYTKTPIKPGESGNVTATYNAANPGSFNKSITVTANDTELNKVLTIKGKVIAPETAPVPATQN